MTVTTLCKCLNVSTSSYYRWRHEPIGKRQQNNADLDNDIVTVFNEHKSRYGSVRIYEQLKDNGWKITQSRVSRHMKLLGLQAKAARKFKITTDSNHNKEVSDNLLEQNFSALDRNHRWITDITYIRTQEGWLYLCVIIDLFSRAVIGWSMDSRMKADLVCSALNMALFRRSFPSGVTVHQIKGRSTVVHNFNKLSKLTG